MSPINVCNRAITLNEPEPHLIQLTFRAAAGFGPELQVYGTDYPTPDETCIRDYTNVVDLAEEHVKALQHLLAGNSSFTVNLGTGEGSSMKATVNLTRCVRQIWLARSQTFEGNKKPLFLKFFGSMFSRIDCVE